MRLAAKLPKVLSTVFSKLFPMVLKAEVVCKIPPIIRADAPRPTIL